MAGYGFGGLGATYPMRFGAPQSQNVMSDTEFNSDWEKKLAAVPQYVDNVISPGGTVYPGSQNYTGYFNPSWQQANASFNAAAGGSDPNAMLATERFLNGYGMTLTPGQSGGFTFGRAADAAQTIDPTIERSINPEWTKLQNQMKNAQDQRSQNQTAQQQAYNGMIGNGQLNGILGADYTKPGFGQINGQTTNPFAPNSGGKGVDMGWTSGVYDPVNAYQSGMYGTTGSPKNQWGF